jgi:hypothetical protein
MITKQSINLDSKITQNNGNFVSDMNGEKVMLSMTNGKYYNMGKIGGEIWDLVQSPITVSSIVEKLLLKYEVEKKECVPQVFSFLNHLHSENLIQIDK